MYVQNIAIGSANACLQTITINNVIIFVIIINNNLPLELIGFLY